ncbi:MAG: hypothetical protein B0D96_00065 [Candidatus Sedimenticola endophacoides]|nr:MAG: hypothetical protein B0D96_00065 [Candidatus Sedimenticola endophacoides]
MAKKVIYQAVTTEMFGGLGKLYGGLGQILRAHGAVADASRPVVKAAPQRRRTADRGPFAVLSRLLGMRGKGRNQMRTEAPEVIPSQRVERYLDQISLTPGRPAAEQIERHLQRAEGRGVALRLEPALRARVDMAEQLINDLHAREGGGRELGDLLSLVRASLIKASVRDPEVLGPDGQGGRLLETIDHLLPYYTTDAGKPRKTPLLHALEELNDTVSGEGADDMACIARRLESILNRQQQEFSDHLSRVVDGAEARLSEQEKRSDILTAIRRQLPGSRLSGAVDQLLGLGWAQLLVQLHIDGQPLEPYLGLLGELEAVFADPGYERLPGSEVTRVLNTLKQGFLLYPVRRAEALVYIKQVVRGLNGGSRVCDPALSRRIESGAGYLERAVGMEREERPATTTDPGDEWMAIVGGLSTGEWIVERRQRARVRMLNLAWRDPDGVRHIFVDGAGDKALDLAAPEVGVAFSDANRHGERSEGG